MSRGRQYRIHDWDRERLGPQASAHIENAMNLGLPIYHSPQPPKPLLGQTAENVSNHPDEAVAQGVFSNHQISPQEISERLQRLSGWRRSRAAYFFTLKWLRGLGYTEFHDRVNPPTKEQG